MVCHNRYQLIAFILLMLLAYPGECQAITFDDFSTTVNGAFASDPFAGNHLIALVSMILLALLVVVSFKWGWRKEIKNVDQHYEQVKKRHNQYMAAVQAGQAQKRQWFRLREPAEFEWLPPHRPSLARRPKYKSDRVIDLSAGGIGFTTTEVLELEDTIRLILYTDEKEPLYLSGRVVRILPDEQSGGMASLIGVSFDDMPESERNRLNAWLIKRQRDFIQKEKAQEQIQLDLETEEFEWEDEYEEE